MLNLLIWSICREVQVCQICSFCVDFNLMVWWILLWIIKLKKYTSLLRHFQFKILPIALLTKLSNIWLVNKWYIQEGYNERSCMWFTCAYMHVCVRVHTHIGDIFKPNIQLFIALVSYRNKLHWNYCYFQSGSNIITPICIFGNHNKNVCLYTHVCYLPNMAKLSRGNFCGFHDYWLYLECFPTNLWL